MTDNVDPALVAFCGSETRVRTLGVLANAERPMTGYRVAKVAGLPAIKVYRELRRAIEARTVRKDANGYRLNDPDIRDLLRRRVRLSWSDEWGATYEERSRRARSRRPLVDAMLAAVDPSKYTPNAEVARRYAKEFERPAVKDEWPREVIGDRASRKRL